MKLEFKPQHFDSLYTLGPGLPEWAAGVAQSLLEEWLKEAPMVYAHDDEPPIWGTMWTLEPAAQLKIKIHHTARLVDIKEIGK